MKLVRTAPAPNLLAGLTPSINVVLLLLLFFLLGSSFVLQPGIRVNLPASHFHLTPIVDAQIVSVQVGPPARIYYDNAPVTIEELASRLAARRGGSQTVIVRADRGTPYDTVMAVGSSVLQQGFNVVLATAPEAVGATPATAVQEP